MMPGASLRQDVAAVAVAIPGHVDPTDGSVSMAVNLGITHLPLGSMLQAELGVPVFVEHDARAAALWLSRQAVDGWADAPPSVAFLAIGTGISAGIVLDGAVLRGDNDFAGEVGHLVADPDGVVCACGLRGCLETIAAGPGIARQADEAMAAGRSTVLSPDASAGDVFRAGFCRRRGRARDHRPRGRPPGPGDPIARPDPRRQARRHRRRRGGRRTRPSRTHPIAHPPRMRGLATGPGRPGRCQRRAAVADRSAWRARGGGDRSPPHRLASARGGGRTITCAVPFLESDTMRGPREPIVTPSHGSSQEEDFMGKRLRTTPALAVIAVLLVSACGSSSTSPQHRPRRACRAAERSRTSAAASAAPSASAAAAPSAAPVAAVPTVPTGYTELDTGIDQGADGKLPFAGKTVSIQTQWIGGEGTNFAASVADFAKATGIKIQIDSIGSSHETVLKTRIEGGKPPDIAQLAQPTPDPGLCGPGQGHRRGHRSWMQEAQR